MLGRGRAKSSRGGPSRKPAALPNLAVAGKRENREQPETSGRGSSRGGTKRGRGRGAGRGGRGGHRDSNKPVFIEQLGIFSSGLNDDGRHDRSKTDVYNEFNVVNFGRGKKVVRSENELERSGDEDVKPPTFESEWLSDEEADTADLTDLLKDNFVADLKRGTVMPLVLPLTEESQFEGLISRDVKKEELEVDAEQMNNERATSQNGVQSKKKPSRRCIESDSDSDELERKPKEMKFKPSTEPIVASSQKVANLLLRLEQEPSDDLLLVQLPSTLLALSNPTDPDSQQTANTNSQQTANTTATVAANKTEDKPPPRPHCLDKFEDGTRLGKLQIRRSGRVELVVGGMRLDVTSGIATRHTESVVLIESTPRREAPKGTPSILKVKQEPMEEDQEPPPDNMFVIGKVGSSLVCSHDFARSLEENKLERKEKARLNKEPSEQLQLDETAGEVKKLLAELRSMELKEKSWIKWTTNYSTSMVEPMDVDDSSS